MRHDTVCIYSGGMDSLTLVALTQHEGRLHSALGFYYGQRHAKELQYAARYCEREGIAYHVIDLSALQRHLRGSALTDSNTALPLDAHHEDVAQRATVVPNRNLMMLSIASAYAMSHDLSRVVFGAHGGDREVYPDCRHEFVAALNVTLSLADWHTVRVEAPFLQGDKTDILRAGLALGVNYAEAWTCYSGGDVSCGSCGSCRERLAAFARIGEVDPMVYA